MSANIDFLYPYRGYYDSVLSYTTETVGNGTTVCMGHLPRRAQLSWKSRHCFWQFHKVRFCVLA